MKVYEDSRGIVVSEVIRRNGVGKYILEYDGTLYYLLFETYAGDKKLCIVGSKELFRELYAKTECVMKKLEEWYNDVIFERKKEEMISKVKYRTLILTLVHSKGKVAWDELKEIVGKVLGYFNPNVVAWHIQKLKEEGLVEVTGSPKTPIIKIKERKNE